MRSRQRTDALRRRHGPPGPHVHPAHRPQHEQPDVRAAPVAKVGRERREVLVLRRARLELEVEAAARGSGRALPWSGRYDFEDADFQDWSLDDGGEAAAPAGQVKGDGSALSFVRVLGAGHMVPMDQPAAALKMITAFTRGEKIASTGTSISKKGGGAAAAVA